MRKIVLMILCCMSFSMGAMGATGKCPVDATGFKLRTGQSAHHDEFLYFGDKVYECDNEYCDGGTKITLEPGHIFQGIEIRETRTYKCHKGGFLGEDRWELLTSAGDTVRLGSSDKPTKTGCGVPIGQTRYAANALRWVYSQNTADNEFIYDNGIVYECDNDYCTEGTQKCFESGHIFKGDTIYNAVTYKCIGRRKWKSISVQKTCNGDNAISITPTECPSGSSDKITSKSACSADQTFKCIKKQNDQCLCGTCEVADKKTCREQRTTLNGKACCDTLSLGVYKKDIDTCECKDEMKFVIENGTGYCRPTQQVGAQYTCDATILAQIAKWKITCAKNSDIVDLINQIETYCTGDNKTETIFMTYYTTLLGYNPQQCGASSTSTTIDYSALSTDVNNAYIQLTSIHNKFRDDVSVWKNEEGKFNTARLASDSIAGVVLGTAGGLITSSVVKKNQVENGFEDIKCTIGGQNVAEWGDQFRVGIQ